MIYGLHTLQRDLGVIVYNNAPIKFRVLIYFCSPTNIRH